MALTFEQARQIARASAPAGGYTDAQINEWANWAVNNPDVQYSSNPAQQMSNSIVISQQGANEQITFNPVAVAPAAPVGIPDENVKAYVDNLVAVGGTNSDIKAAMDLYGVSPEQLARVYNADPAVIREAYNVVQASPVSNVTTFEQEHAAREAAKATVTPTSRGGVETITIQPREQITVNPAALASLNTANNVTLNTGTASPTPIETGAMGPYASAPSVTPEEITASYTRFLNRTPGQEEIDFWTNYSRNNDPTQTANAFISEARKEIGDITRSAYESYLGRTPSQEEIDYWTNYTIENDALKTVDAWRVAADEELGRRSTVSDATTDLQESGIQGSLVSESTEGIPYGGGIYKRTPDEEARYLAELAGIPVRTTIPTPVMPTTTGISRAMTPYVAPGGPGEEAGYARIRELLASGEYTPEQIREGQRNLGVTDQDIGVATGAIAQPIRMPTPTLPGATTGTTQSIDEFIRSRAPTATPPTAPSMFSPENVTAQLELERLRSGVSPKNTLTDLYGSFLGTRGDINRVIQENRLTADQLKTMYGADDTGISTLQSMGINPYTEPTPVAGFAEGGLVGNDINRLLQNQRNAVMRDSQSRQMLTTLGAPPVKKFSDGGPAGSSSSGVRRLEMSKIRKRQEGSPPEGEMANDEFIQEMMTGTRPTDQEAFVERTSDILSKTPKSQELANQIRNLFQSLETPSPSAQEEYLERRPTPESREPIRSRKAMEAFLKAANPRLEIEERPLPGGKFGFVRADDPDTLVISTRQFPAQREETAFHELEHSLSERGGNPLGKLSKEGKPIVMDNNYRFDVLYNQDKKIGGEGRFARFDMMNRFIKNKDKLEKFFGRPFDSNYFSREPESGLFAEQIADLSALEQVTNKSLTRDPEMRKLLFPDDKAAAVYDAITGLRQTRLDAKDLPPYTPNYPEEKSMMDWIRGKLGMDKK